MSDTDTSAKTSLKQLLRKLQTHLRRVQPYSLPLFIVFVVLLYGFIVLRVNHFTSAQPTEDAINSQVKATKSPRVDQTVLKQLKDLQDNSVSVQTLFNDARSNPFSQ